MKKSWKKPKLVVLVRGKPAEVVLTACKGGDQAQGGLAADAISPSFTYTACYSDANLLPCTQCFGIQSS